jgi:hypothetical protein
MLGLFSTYLQKLRVNLKVVDESFGTGTGSVDYLKRNSDGIQMTSNITGKYPAKKMSYLIQIYLISGNTAIVYHHGKVLALNEGDKPCKFLMVSILSGSYLV